MSGNCLSDLTTADKPDCFAGQLGSHRARNGIILTVVTGQNGLYMACDHQNQHNGIICHTVRRIADPGNRDATVFRCLQINMIRSYGTCCYQSDSVPLVSLQHGCCDILIREDSYLIAVF